MPEDVVNHAGAATAVRTIRFRVEAVPTAQPRPRAFVRGGHARVYGAEKSHPVHAFKASVALAARLAYRGAPLEGPLAVSFVFVLPRPGRLMWKRREMPRVWHQGRPDCENIAKAGLDALTALCWRDDAQVARLVLEKWYAAGDESPHVEVVVECLEV